MGIGAEAQRDRKVIFLHLMKTAGTTLDRIIRRQYGESKVVRFFPKKLDENISGFKALSEAERSNVKVIMGHFHFGLHQRLPGEYTYITVLRNPVDRIISEYYYILTHPEHKFHERMTSNYRTLTDFVKSGMYHSLDNAQTKYISARKDLEYGSYVPEALETARENLQNHFAVAGLTEKFDETLILLKRIFGWRTPYYLRENVTMNRPKKGSLAEEELQVINNYARMDLELNEFASGRLEEQFAAQGDDFIQEVEVFKLLNQHCGPFLPQLADPGQFDQVECLLALKTVSALVNQHQFDKALTVLSYALKQHPDATDLLKLQDLMNTGSDTIARENAPSKRVEESVSVLTSRPHAAAINEKPDVHFPLIYLHLMKAAGNTLRAVMRRQYGEDQVHIFYSTPGALMEIPPGIKVIAGHIQFGFFEEFPSPATWITALRNPVDRIISDYNYILEAPDQHFHKYAKVRSIDKFLEDGFYLWGDNAQVKFLSGVVDVPFGQCNAELLARARANLKKHFAVVGTSEKFDETLILLKRTLGWRTPYYVRENVSTKRIRKKDLQPEVLAIVEKYQTFDCELYRYAEELFSEQIAHQDDSFHEEVQVFKLLNDHCARYLSDLADPEKFPGAEIQVIGDTVFSLLREEKYDQATLVLGHSLRKYPDSPDLHNLAALIKYKQGRVEEAKSIFVEITRRWPSHPSAYNFMGAVLWDAGDIENAMKNFLAALKIDPCHRGTVINCGKALAKFNKRDDALNLYSFYIEKNPRDGEVIWLKNYLAEGKIGQPSLL